MTNILAYMSSLAVRFRKDEEGLALTEYLVLLALLVAGIIGAVTLYGEALEGAWTNWSSWATAVLGQTP
ncbi:Flp family type IVb pilin [Litorisediminicola beolgyonensis]|uniref:Flp family type IVb pilin n=1 Tax=Litorisediminicola beolgyonensis TaxID=1173614 RepID=A0ABW3ZDB2_9RHOB